MYVNDSPDGVVRTVSGVKPAGIPTPAPKLEPSAGRYPINVTPVQLDRLGYGGLNENPLHNTLPYLSSPLTKASPTRPSGFGPLVLVKFGSRLVQLWPLFVVCRKPPVSVPMMISFCGVARIENILPNVVWPLANGR